MSMRTPERRIGSRVDVQGKETFSRPFARDGQPLTLSMAYIGEKARKGKYLIS